MNELNKKNMIPIKDLQIDKYFDDKHNLLYRVWWYKNNPIVFKTYYLSGSLHSVNYLQDGQFHGTAKYYNENGQLEIEVISIRGKIREVIVHDKQISGMSEDPTNPR